MNNIWGSMEQYDPVVWNWIIAVYLFMAGASAGSLLIAIGLRKFRKGKSLSLDNVPMLKAAAWVAPITICMGMALLVLDLTKPLMFWKILINYNFTSVMSVGVLALSLYIPLVFVHSALELDDLVEKYLPFLTPVLAKIRPLQGLLDGTLFVLALGVAAYTGFLLSALGSYPILNTAILPGLFLASALSVGNACNTLVATLVYRGRNADCLGQTHAIEPPVAIGEVLCLLMLFMGLALGGPAHQAALEGAFFGDTAWTWVFWLGAVGLGLGLPVIGPVLASAKTKHSTGFLVTMACSTIIGVMALRHFVIYAGQSYVL